MYGDRARIGLIVPSSNAVMEPEFYAMKPDDVSVHSTRVPLTRGTIEGLEKMEKGVEKAAKLLAHAGVNIIAYGCTTGSMLKGLDWDSELISRIERVTKIPATTTTTAVMRIFKKFGIKKISIATPYHEELDRLEREFFQANGIKVVNMKGLNFNSKEMWLASPEITYELACMVDTPEADAVFISCTNFKSATIIGSLEQKLRKFVISSNRATMWDVLERLNIHFL